MAIVYNWRLNGGFYGYIIDPDKVQVDSAGEMVSPYEYKNKGFALESCVTEGRLSKSDEAKVTSWVNMLDESRGYEPYEACFKHLTGLDIVKKGKNIFLPVDDYLHASDNCDSLKGPRGYSIKDIVPGFEDDPEYDDVEKLKYYAVLDDKDSTRIEFMVPRGPKGASGADGNSSFRVPMSAYMVLKDGIIPDSPVGGSYDFSTEEVIMPEIRLIGESVLKPEMFPGGKIPEGNRCTEDPVGKEGFNVWCSYGIFGMDDEGKSFMKKEWSVPFQINGADGNDGADGENIQFMFRLTEDESKKPVDIERDGTKEDNIKLGWSDSPKGINKKEKVEWMIQRTRNKELDTWSSWNGPVIWSRWGEDGRDGDGIEYIYRLTKRGERPLLRGDDSDAGKHAFSDERYAKMTGYQTNDFVPKNTDAENEANMANWTDNPTREENKDYECEWVCVRRKTVGEDGVATWGKYSYPALWSEKGETGAPGEVGPSGLSGVGYAIRYHWGDEEGPKNIQEGKLVPAEVVADNIDIEEIEGSGWFKDKDLFQQDKIDNKEFEEKNPELVRDCIWIIQARCTCEAKTIDDKYVKKEVFEEGETWFGPIRVNGVQGLQGEPGSRAPIIYSAGVYSPDKAYTVSSGKGPYVYDTVTNCYYVYNQEFDGTNPEHIWYGGKESDDIDTTYTVTIDGKEVSGVPSRYGKLISKDPYWEKLEQFEALYAKVGVIANGLIGEAVFNNEFMFSQRGVTPNGNMTTHYEKFRSAYNYDEESGLYYLDGVVVGRNEYIPVVPDDDDVFLTGAGFNPSSCIEISEGKVPYAKFKKELFTDRCGKWEVGRKVLIGLKCHEYPIYHISDENGKRYKLQFTGKYIDTEAGKDMAVFGNKNEYPVVEYFANTTELTGTETVYCYVMTPEGGAKLSVIPKFKKETLNVETVIPGKNEGKYFMNYYDIVDETSAKPRENYESWTCDSKDVLRYGLVPGSPDPYLKNKEGVFVNSFTPNFCLNFKTGEAWFANGNIHMGGDGHATIDGTLAMRNNGEITAFLNGSGDISRVPKNNIELDDSKVDSDNEMVNIPEKVIFASGIKGLRGSLGDKKTTTQVEKKYYVWRLVETGEASELAAFGDSIDESDAYILTDKPYGQTKMVDNDENSDYEAGENSPYGGMTVNDAYIEKPRGSGKVIQLSGVKIKNIDNEGTWDSSANKGEGGWKENEERTYYSRLHLTRRFKNDDGKTIDQVYYPVMMNEGKDGERQSTSSIKEDPLSNANTMIFENGCLQTTSLWAYDGFFGGELNANGYFNGSANLKNSRINNSTLNDSILSGSVKCGKDNNISIIGDNGVILDAGNRKLEPGVSHGITTPWSIYTGDIKNSSLSKWMERGNGLLTTNYLGTVSVNNGTIISLGKMSINGAIYAANRKWMKSKKRNPELKIRVAIMFKDTVNGTEKPLYETASPIRRIEELKGEGITVGDCTPSGNWKNYDVTIDLDKCLSLNEDGFISSSGEGANLENMWNYENSGLVTVELNWLASVPPNQPGDKSLCRLSTSYSKNFEVYNTAVDFSEIGKNGVSFVSKKDEELSVKKYYSSLSVAKTDMDSIKPDEYIKVVGGEEKEKGIYQKKGDQLVKYEPTIAKISAINGEIVLSSGSNYIKITPKGIFYKKKEDSEDKEFI